MADEDEKDNLLEYLGRFVEIMKLLSFVVIDLDKHVTDHVQHMGVLKERVLELAWQIQQEEDRQHRKKWDKRDGKEVSPEKGNVDAMKRWNASGSKWKQLLLENGGQRVVIRIRPKKKQLLGRYVAD